MHRVELAHAADFDGWRRHARLLAAQSVSPEAVCWQVRSEVPSLLLARDAANDALPCAAGAPAADAALRVPRAFIELARNVVLHNDPGRFELLYRVLLRLQREPRLLSLTVDPDVARLARMQKAVAHDIHRMHAYLRFRRVADERGERFVAYYEPEHHIVEAAAPFFVNRYAGQDWAILTPQCSLLWSRARDRTTDREVREEELTIGPGVTRDAAPATDALEDLWRAYYASTFNPARLNRRALQSHMPRRFWPQLPEAQLIEPLVAAASARTARMVAAPTPPPRRSRTAPPAPRAPSRGAAGEPTKAAIDACRRCPLWKGATQGVPGEGPPRARLMLVGEQPGDQEDLAGRPFVGPAGRLLDRALEEAGIDRTQVYVTNAVKHFKYELRGKRRLHKKPSDMEVEACHVWLQEELEAVGPALVVALGATALRALTGRAMPVQANRGTLLPLDENRQLLVTVHPSFLLRVPPENREREYAAFVADLRIAAQWLRGHGA